MRAAKKAVDDDTKLVLGVGLYGRNWVVGTIGTCPATAEGTTPVTQRNVRGLAAKRNATPVHDPFTRRRRSPTTSRSPTPAPPARRRREVHFIDEQGARPGVDLARDERIGGVAFWALGFDSDAMWAAVADVARPQR